VLTVRPGIGLRCNDCGRSSPPNVTFIALDAYEIVAIQSVCNYRTLITE
jgi:hypothetical protein